eukprot:gnl/MRDRNA2_/MRDRNA2_33308_c0_seq1.p1 gnl/MRDRNA2_/MRDRNA2_33308_c0~~gnl/MRDRNA2_/MRDRNA2_33308_c0_seq1.p1  ORF type:complete len:341 (-),score=74.58 gnl/MRDRNA2_/MRDRNA2_33308_c0_seq1:89-1111(-)
MPSSLFQLLKKRVCVGTWAWGASEQPTNSGGSAWAGTGSTGKEPNSQAFAACLRHGVFFFDTAEVYNQGESERLVGEFIKEHQSKDEKLHVVVATKFVPLPWRIFQSSLSKSLKESLARLQMPSVDLYQIHGPAYSWFRSVDCWAEALAMVQKEGLAKEVGVSNYNSDQVLRTVHELKKHDVQLASNQIEYSLLHRYPEESGLIKACHDLGIEILAYSPLAMGRLTGKIKSEEDFNKLTGDRKFGARTWQEVEPVLMELRRIAEKYTVTGAKGQEAATVSQIALAWVKAKGCIPIVGCKTEAQADENLKFIDVNLNEEDVAALDKVSCKGKPTYWQGSSN